MKTKKSEIIEINPFLIEAIEAQNIGSKILFNADKRKVKVDINVKEMNEKTKETTEEFEEKEIDFYTSIPIDKAQFIRVYEPSFQAFSKLEKCASHILFGYLFELMKEQFLIDNYYLSYSDYQHRQTQNNRPTISERHFERAISNLLELRVIAKHRLDYIYYINIAFIFNGNRVKFIKEQQKKLQSTETDKPAPTSTPDSTKPFESI